MSALIYEILKSIMFIDIYYRYLFNLKGIKTLDLSEAYLILREQLIVIFKVCQGQHFKKLL